jgi:hypothetical protein
MKVSFKTFVQGLIILTLGFNLTSCGGFKTFKEARGERKQEKVEKPASKADTPTRAELFNNENLLPDYYWERTVNNFFWKGDSENKSDSLLIRFERTPCFGECKAFVVEIFNSGIAKFEDRFFVEPQGTQLKSINKDTLLQIVSLAKALDLESLASFYGDKAMDLPTVKIGFYINNSPIEIEYNMDEPKELSIFTRRFEQLILPESWY